MPEFAALAIHRNSFVRRADRMLLASSKVVLLAVLVLLQVLLLYGDYLTGPYIPFGVFYLLSLYLAVKYLKIRDAYILAFLLVAGKTYVKQAMLPNHLGVWQVTWQFLSSLSIYSTFCYLINSLIMGRKYAEGVAVLAIQRASVAEHKLLNISEQTQQRIGRELHDDLGQHLTASAFMAQVVASKLAQAGAPQVDDAQRVTSMLDEAIAKTRNLAHGLYPEEIQAQSLLLMLEQLASHIEAIYPIRCVFMGEQACHIKNKEVTIHLFRIIQEAINNALKHGQATHITLSMSGSVHTLKLEILDNGSGFIPATSSGLGLRSMRYRADIIGASLNIAPRIEGGTRVEINMQFDS